MIKMIKDEAKKNAQRDIIIDAALAVDLKLEKLCDKIIIIKRDKHIKKGAEAEKIARNQKMPERADFTVINKGGKKELKAKIKDIKRKLGI